MEIEEKLLGHWILDPADAPSKQLFGNTSLEFTSKGELVYTIHGDKKDQKIFMRYWIKDNLLVTDQPSNPGVEESEFRVTPDGKLKIVFEGIESHYIKLH